jgi:hypothetical protein
MCPRCRKSKCRSSLCAHCGDIVASQRRTPANTAGVLLFLQPPVPSVRAEIQVFSYQPLDKPRKLFYNTIEL